MWSSLRTKSLAVSCRIARPQPSLSKVKAKTHLSVRVDTRLSQHQVRSISLCSNDPHPLPLPSQNTNSFGCHGRNYVGERLQHVIIVFEPPPTLHFYIPVQLPPPPPPTSFSTRPPLHSYIPIPPHLPPPSPAPRQAQTHLGVMEGTTLLNLVKSQHQVSWISSYSSSLTKR